MTIQLNPHSTLGDLQEKFNATFPFLRIVFFSKGHETGKGTEKKFIKDPQTLIAECSAKKDANLISFNTFTTVGELEKMFEEKLGLFVQVFRRSGNLWLETTATDNWSLHHQNEQGKELSSSDWRKPSENIDYHEQE
jgi:hypothetical protein